MPTAMKKRAKWILFSVSLIAILVLLLPVFFNAVACRNHLSVVQYDVNKFRLGHGGNYPSNILVATRWIEDDHLASIDFVRSTLTCPGGQSTKDADFHPDYIYINWEPFFGSNRPPDDYPIAYDRKMSNHLGLGINIIKMAGFPTWDFRGRGLKHFAEEHPEYHLELPN